MPLPWNLRTPRLARCEMARARRMVVLAVYELAVVVVPVFEIEAPVAIHAPMLTIALIRPTECLHGVGMSGRLRVADVTQA